MYTVSHYRLRETRAEEILLLCLHSFHAHSPLPIHADALATSLLMAWEFKRVSMALYK